MTALSTPRVASPSSRIVKRDRRPLAAAVKSIQGGAAMVILAGAGAGYYAPASSALVGVVVGIFLETVDNTAGAAGDRSAGIEFAAERELIPFVNDSGAPLVAANREGKAFVLDDQTVTATPSSAVCGVLYEIDANSVVWVDVAAAESAGESASVSRDVLLFDKVAADATAATATAEHTIFVATGAETFSALKYVPDAAVTADDTNFATITIKKRDGAGGGASTVASIATKITAGTGNWLAFIAEDFGALTGGKLATGTLLTITIAKSGSGVAIPAGKLYGVAAVG